MGISMISNKTAYKGNLCMVQCLISGHEIGDEAACSHIYPIIKVYQDISKEV